MSESKKNLNINGKEKMAGEGKKTVHDQPTLSLKRVINAFINKCSFRSTRKQNETKHVYKHRVYKHLWNPSCVVNKT